MCLRDVEKYELVQGIKGILHTKSATTMTIYSLVTKFQGTDFSSSPQSCCHRSNCVCVLRIVHRKKNRYLFVFQIEDCVVILGQVIIKDEIRGRRAHVQAEST